MQADTTTLAPTDAEIEAMRDAFDWDGWTCPKAAQRAFARAVLAKWGAPAPASGEPKTALEAVIAGYETSMQLNQKVTLYFRDAKSATRWHDGFMNGFEAAPPAQEALVPLKVREFEEWLNDHRGASVSEVFHDVVAHYKAARSIGITAAQKETP